MTPVILISNCVINRLLGRRRSSNSTKSISETGPTVLKVSSHRVTLCHQKLLDVKVSDLEWGAAALGSLDTGLRAIACSPSKLMAGSGG